MPRIDCDVCIIGGGISAALMAQKLSERKLAWTSSSLRPASASSMSIAG